MVKKILLIEDDNSIRTMLQNWFIQAGYDVVLATEGGDEGILLAVTESPDLIVIDTDLRVIDGWQAIKILKASTVTQGIPIVVLTVPATDLEWKRVLDSSCNACELKPIDRKSILGKIKALTEPIAVSTDTNFSKVPTEPFPALFPNHLFPPQAVSKMSSRLVGITDSAATRKLSNQSMVVYIDDSPLDSQHMAEIVEQAGYSYDNITEPLKALPLLLEMRPKLIFLDLVMPYTNGYEMCSQIRRASAFNKIPIVIVTNNNGIVDRIRARFVGASGFFTKPAKEEQVVKVLKKYLDPAPANTAKRSYKHALLPFV